MVVEAITDGGILYGLVAVGAGLATGLAGIGAGVGEQGIGAAVVGVVARTRCLADPDVRLDTFRINAYRVRGNGTRCSG
jgi:F0F1-type ATP synthase membrane subunit c/vacuolar-type H+-ATPase subunit K